MESDIALTWESMEKITIDKNSTVKDVIQNNLESLKFQLFGKDYNLKFNNNSISKLLINTKITELTRAFHGSRIDLEMTENSKKEMEELKQDVKNLEQKIVNTKSTFQEKVSTLKAEFSKENLEKLITSKIKEFEKDDFFEKTKVKILKKIGFTADVLKEAKDLKDNFKNIRANENILIFNKIIDNYWKDVYEFVYKHYLILLSDTSLLKIFVEAFRSCQIVFIKKVSESLKLSSPDFFKNFQINLDNVKEYFNQIEPYVLLFRSLRIQPNVPPVTIYFNYEGLIKVNYGEELWREITKIIDTFPSIDIMKANLPPEEKDIYSAYYFYSFERDLRIYEIFGVKIEDYLCGHILYDQ